MEHVLFALVKRPAEPESGLTIAATDTGISDERRLLSVVDGVLPDGKPGIF